MGRYLYLKGVKTHNLKNIDLSLPLEGLICITGPSGSGKSSLAFDTIYREGRRRYVQALALNERHIVLEPPVPVREAEGLPPTIALEQKVTTASARSTVGTITGLLEPLRVLFAEIGYLHCPQCGSTCRPMSVSDIATRLLSLPKGTKIYILAPLVTPTPKALDFLQSQGFSRFLINDQLVDLTEEDLTVKLEKVHIVVDRLVLKPDLGPRLVESLHLAASLSGGSIHIRSTNQKEWAFSTSWRCPSCGTDLPKIRPENLSFNHPLGACSKCNGLGQIEGEPCPECKGSRLKPLAQNTYLQDLSFTQLLSLPLKDLQPWLASLNFVGLEKKIFDGLRPEIEKRLEALSLLDLTHLNLVRSLQTLSFGERQRLRLASLLGARLSGCLYILDEPGLGLSPLEKERLLFVIQRLIQQGNTVIMVEHDPLLIKAADMVVECGPGAGEKGGEILFVGPPEELAQNEHLPTGSFWAGQKRLKRYLWPKKPSKTQTLTTRVGNFSVPSPGVLVICGPSGAGKTLLLQEICDLSKSQGKKAEYVRPIEAKGARSVPVSYIGALNPIRDLFSQLPEARMRGLRPAHFSFFSKEGRCPRCKGEGEMEIKIPLHPPLRVVCTECGGTRYRPDVLDVRYRGFSIADILECTVTEARKIFSRIPAVNNRLALLEEVGLGYLRLGQNTASLSGGERQRLVLARTLAQKFKGLLFLDLPSLGLHLEDINNLWRLFDKLIQTGCTIIVADNHPGLVLLADVICVLERGKLTFCGSPRDWLKQKDPFAQRFEPYVSLISWD